MNIKYFFYILLLFFLSTPSVNAATLKVTPEFEIVNIGQEFTVTITVDSEEELINAAQTTLLFPTEVLQVVNTDKTGTVFNFWVVEPEYSNENGTLDFIAGTANSRTGTDLRVLSVAFKATGVGNGNIKLQNSVVAASDGKGTNVLSSVVNATVKVDTSVVTPSESELNPSTILTPEPKKVTRVAIKSEELPGPPKITVPLYPNTEIWYRHADDLTILWEVPKDITKVAVSVDGNPNSEPTQAEEMLFTGKKVEAPVEGVTYVHVQFKNNVGWGEVSHYKISIDVTPPIPFNLNISSKISDDPTPLLTFDTQDALSGISHTLVSIDGKSPVRVASSTLILPVQYPGNHKVNVKIFDFANNSIEKTLIFETLPLPTPIIDFVTPSVSHSETMFISGKTKPNSFVDISLINKRGKKVLNDTVVSDGGGAWNNAIESSFPVGKYLIQATARDVRGAVSYPTEAEVVKIKTNPIFALGIFEFGWFEIFLVFLIFIFIALIIFAFIYIRKQNLKTAYQIITIRDVKKLTTLIEEDNKKLEEWIAALRVKSQNKEEMLHLTAKIKEVAGKMKKYLEEEIRKL